MKAKFRCITHIILRLRDRAWWKIPIIKPSWCTNFTYLFLGWTSQTSICSEQQKTKFYLKLIKQKQDFLCTRQIMYNSMSIVSHSKLPGPFKVNQLIPVACMYKVLTSLFTPKPCDKWKQKIGFKRENDKATDLGKRHYFFRYHDLS
jgi:hypothetical protein